MCSYKQYAKILVRSIHLIKMKYRNEQLEFLVLWQNLFSIMKKYFSLILVIGLIAFINCSRTKKPISTKVRVVGAMRNVMMKGQLYGTISLDTIANKTHLYGLGPIEYLTGEILILDGRAYKSTIKNDSTMLVEESFDLKAPFFVYANVDNWNDQVLPDSIETIPQLEQYLNKIFIGKHSPVAFRIEGTVKSASIHVVNLPAGSKVQSPQDAHVGQVGFKIENENVTIVGFFSLKHKSIFTHHDSYLHMHLITSDKMKMGHLDKLQLKPGSFLWLASEE